MSDTPTPEAIEAAARALSGLTHEHWEIAATHLKDSNRWEAQVALSAAAPFIAAQVKAEALREAADAWGAGEWMDDFTHVTDDVSAVQATVKWLRARAATIEGKNE